MAPPTTTNPSENAFSNEEKTETAGSSSGSVNPAQNAVPKVIVEHVLDLPKMWTNNNLLPAYYVALEKYFTTRNILDENARFVALSNVMSSKQIEKHSLSLTTLLMRR